jgi:nitrogen fixation NifU-like protein
VSEALYQSEILSLAKVGRAVPRLDNATVSARVDNPVCGDRVTVDLALEDGTVTAVGAKVQGCALCQASVAAIAEHAVGRPAADLEDVEKALETYLAGSDTCLPWTSLSSFAPVKGAKSRWDCVMLPFRAANKALRQVGTSPDRLGS